MGRTVYLAEKPNMGKVIASALAKRDRISVPKARNGKIDGGAWTVCWLAGHAYSLLDAKDYKEEWSQPWSRLNLPIIPEEMTFKPIEGDFIEGCRNAAKSAIDGADTVVIATDAGQEGQIIAEIFLDQIGWKGNTLRLWSSVANQTEITRALNNLQPNTDQKFQGLRESGLVRMKGDWLIGINFTIAYTNIARKAGYDLLASAGRVQSACLAICVDHDAMVEQFKSSSYFDVEAVLETESGELVKAQLSIPEHLLHDGVHCIDEGALNQIISACSGKAAEVASCAESHQSYKPPTPFNLTTLCMTLSRNFNITAGEVMSLYQTMYEAGWLSYTRTDDTFYEDDQFTQINEQFRMLRDLAPEFAPLVDGADTSKKPDVFDSSKIVEHAANSPTLSRPKWSEMDLKSKDIYRTVAKQMIAQFYPNHVTTTLELGISIGQHLFTCKGITVKEPGWTKVIPKHNDEGEVQPIPRLEKGSRLNVISIEKKAKKTRAPARMTEAKLLGIMENASAYLGSEQTRKRLGENATLGTAATRPGIVETLVETRRYLNRDGKGVIRPTQMGKRVRALLPPELSTPDLSALWEINFQAIRKGRADPNEFLAKTKSWVSSQMQIAKSRTIKPNPLAFKCPTCSNPMTRKNTRDGNSHYWSCINTECKTTVPDYQGKPMEPLPGDGTDCPKCNKPFQTKLRNLNKLSLSERRKVKDARFLVCEGGHYHN